MRKKICTYCKQKFGLSPRNPDQRACGSPECQRRRRADYHRKKLATDSMYREQCRDSRKKWRERNADRLRQYDKEYRARQRMLRSRSVKRSRALKEVRRLVDLVKNHAAFELQSFGANVLLVYPQTLSGRASRTHCLWQPQMIWWRVSASRPPGILKGREYCGDDWTELLDGMLLGLAGYQQLGAIAKIVHRSKRAVWHRLLVLAKKARPR